MEEKLVIAVISGTTRPGRQSIKAARYVAEIGQLVEGVEIVFVDPTELDLSNLDPNVSDPRYSEIVARADGFFIVTPEYNHGYPSLLKRLLDSEYDNYAHKAVAVAGVSRGSWGGVRVVEALLGPLRELGLAIARNNTYFPMIETSFTDDGQPTPDQKDSIDKRIKAAYKELIFLAKSLKYGRNNF